MRRWGAMGLIAAAAAAACAGPARAGGCGDLAGVRQRWADDLWHKDVSASVSLYTPDGTFFDPSGGVAHGAAQIRALYSTVTARFDSRLVFASEVARCVGNLATDQGDYSETMTDRESHVSRAVRGSYLMVLQRGGDGVWRIASQMWTAAAGK